MDVSCVQRNSDAGATRHRHVTFTTEQALTGKMYGHARCRTGGLHADAGALQIQLVGNASDGKILFASEYGLVQGALVHQRPINLRISNEIRIAGHTSKDADQAIVFVRRVSCVLQRRRVHLWSGSRSEGAVMRQVSPVSGRYDSRLPLALVTLTR